MKKYKYISTAFLAAAILVGSSCKKYLDVNVDPNNILGTPANAPLPQILTSATVNIGFTGGSDLSRYTALVIQHFSGQSTGSLNQTQQYEQYLIQPSDLNNLWSSFYSTTINDLETVITKAKATGSPHYAGVAEILRAYTYQTMVDTWGKIPYSQANKTVANLNPAYDDDAAIYTDLIKQIDQGITDLNAANPSGASIDPGTNSTFYQGTFTAAKPQWIKFANTLKLRIYLHYSKKDAAFATSGITALINAAGTTFMASNADNFAMPFTQTSGAQNPIYQFDIQRANYLVANNTIVSMMNTKADPRRPFYFTAIGGVYKGAKGGDAPNAAAYSKIGTYLKGTKGEAPIRMLTYAEYNFIRAEAALTLSAPGSAQAFYTAGITASMQDAGVATADINTYLAANGTLSGTTAQQLSQIITEKYIASYGQVTEPWTDFRRTGYPAAIVPPVNALLTYVPRSFYYPQSEIDANTSAKQKSGMDSRIFWDAQ
jgi:Starch-binding associating with outer membrane